MFSSVAWAEGSTDYSNNVSNTTQVSTMPIKAVSADEAVPKIVSLLMSIHEAIGGFIVPLAMACIALLALVFIVGFIPGLHFLRTVGWLGLLFCCFGVFLYAAAPVIVGLIYGAGASLN